MYRSKFEATVIKKLKSKKIKFFYEREKIKYVQPVIHRSYLPDLYFPSTNVYVEIKGRFKVDERNISGLERVRIVIFVFVFKILMLS
jgi:hypothetical protein